MCVFVCVLRDKGTPAVSVMLGSSRLNPQTSMSIPMSPHSCREKQRGRTPSHADSAFLYDHFQQLERTQNTQQNAEI